MLSVSSIDWIYVNFYYLFYWYRTLNKAETETKTGSQSVTWSVMKSLSASIVLTAFFYGTGLAGDDVLPSADSAAPLAVG